MFVERLYVKLEIKQKIKHLQLIKLVLEKDFNVPYSDRLSGLHPDTIILYIFI